MKVVWAVVSCLLACSDEPGTRDVADTHDVALDSADASVPDTIDPTDAETDTLDVEVEVAPLPCQPRPIDDGGTLRGDRAANFELALADGDTFELAALFTGCNSVVVISDLITISELDTRSVWERDADLMDLIERSPDDVHYVFVSVASEALAPASISAMQARIDATIASVDGAFATHWRDHLHVAAARAQDLDGWVGDALVSHLVPGFAIDHDRRIRGLGSLADVTRYDPALAAMEAWPWRANLAYAAHEALYMRAEAGLRKRLEAEAAAVVEVFTGEVLSQFAEAEFTIPEGDFDTIEVEITQRCPDPTKPEFGNCGAWDYLASLSFEVAGDGGPIMREAARFITTYHREAHWVADITPMLALLSGPHKLRWEWAPEWNVQPTATWLSLRFSNRGKALRPTSTSLLFTGGDFGSAYNDRAPVTFDVPATTRRAELWSLVTGHGAGTNQCAEFCAHGHTLTVGDRAYEKVFREADDEDGCIPAISRGMTPNQGGTWWFGRGGWCPGAPVEPWIIDVTADLTPGTTATFTYAGTLAGRTPPDGSGNIVLTTYLVLFE